jgi:phosphoglycolate phosphatase
MILASNGGSMNYHAVLFDLDGTLANTLDDLADAMNWVLTELHLPTHPVDRYRHKVGDGVSMLVRRSLPADRGDLLDTAAAMMRRRYSEHLFDKTGLYDGIAELLDALAAKRIKLAVLSNKPHPATVEVVSRLLARWAFDAVRGVMENGPLKPDPAGALAIAEQLQIPPARWLYVGDTNVDIRTARSAGMFAVGALWGFRDAAELSAAGADALIGRPMELLELLKR